MRVSRRGMVMSSLPSLFMLAFYYSLAVHMRQSLGAWPTSIGERGFPPLLVAHASVAIGYFSILLLLEIFVVPPTIVVCLVVPFWRRLVPYLAYHAVLFLGCWALMQLAPEPFLHWWKD
jgi:hypothetical protein